MSPASMKLFHSLFILLVMTSASAAEVTNLRCQRDSAPLGVDERNPRLSWQLSGSKHDLKQLAYQILVARSRDDLEKEKLAWDTGKVASHQSIHVPYAGQELESRGRYYWKVRVWTHCDGGTGRVEYSLQR